MATIYISLGSNIDREMNTRAGVASLREQFGELQLSSVYESEAVGFEGSSFYNMVIAASTESQYSKSPLFCVRLKMPMGVIVAGQNSLRVPWIWIYCCMTI